MSSEPDSSSPWARLRPRLARLVAFFGLLAVGYTIERSAPREVVVIIDVGPRAERPEGLEMSVAGVTDEEPLIRTRLMLMAEGPRRIEHRVRMAPGAYRIDVLAMGRGQPEGDAASAGGARLGVHAVSRSFQVPTEGSIVVALPERSP